MISTRLLTLILLGVLGLVVLVLGLRFELSLDTIAERELVLRQQIAALPLRAFFIGLGIYLLASLVPGTAGKSVIVGWLFGLWQGTAIVLAGLLAAGLLSFWVSRVWLRGWVEARFAVLAHRVNTALARDGAIYLLTLQLTSIPWSLLNWVCGVTRVRVWTFSWTMAVGVLPGTLVLVNLGTELPTLRVLLDEGVGALIDPALAAALLALAALPITVRYCARRLGRVFRAPQDAGTSESR